MGGRRGGNIWPGRAPPPWRATRPATPDEVRESARRGKRVWRIDGERQDT